MWPHRDTRPENGNEALCAPLVIVRQARQTVVAVRVKDHNPQRLFDRGRDRRDHRGPAPGGTMSGVRTVGDLRQLDKVAEEERVAVPKPRVAHEPEGDVLVAARPEDRIPERLAGAERYANLDFSRSAQNAAARRR